MAELIIKGRFLLERIQGKGGWTYARLPGVYLQKGAPFGWMQVNGTIDHYELKQYKLMPFGDGGLFLPVSAKVRTAIKKQAGDYIDVCLFRDEVDETVDMEIKETLLLIAPKSLETYMLMSKEVKNRKLLEIQSAKSESEKVQRISDFVDFLGKME